MVEKIPDPISIPEKILQTLFKNLEKQEGFDQSIICQLRALADQDELTKVEKVISALKTDTGGNNEAR